VMQLHAAAQAGGAPEQQASVGNLGKRWNISPIT